MDFDDPIQQEAFFAVHNGLPREGPGNRESTRRALELVGELPARPRVLDLGCGPGLQTLHLAELLPSATIEAIDLHGPFIEHLRGEIERLGLGDRMHAQQANMASPPFEKGSFDLLWCEGAAYILGFEKALTQWRELLTEGGALAATEAVWLRSDPPKRVRACWEEYPDLVDLEASRERVRAAGYRLVGDFVLPPEAWTELYYDPMEERLRELAPRYEGQVEAQLVLDECQEEIDVFRQFSDYYSYAFFVCRAL